MDATKILTREEISLVLADLHIRAARSLQNKRNLAIFRLSCCCGLRAKEIAGLNVEDVMTTGPRPAVRVRKAITKGQLTKRKGRIVPLWWDAGTLADIAEWVTFRRYSGAGDDSPLICSLSQGNTGDRLTPKDMNKRWRTAIKVLGPERVKQVSVHCGRHSFCSHAILGGLTVAEVRDAAGHRNISTTSIYVHVISRQEKINLFGAS